MPRFFDDTQPQYGMQRSSGGWMDNGPSIIQNQSAYQYQSLPPPARMDDIVIPGRAPMYRTAVQQTSGPMMVYQDPGPMMVQQPTMVQQPMMAPGPMMVYKTKQLDPADQAVYGRYLTEGRPGDVIDDSTGKFNSKTSWSGMWRPTKAYSSQQQQQQMVYVEPPPPVMQQQMVYVDQPPMVQQQMYTTDYIPAGYETQVIGGPAPMMYKKKKHHLFGM